MRNGRPILVTGGHRSGTGWVGEMLARTPSPAVGYIWEPFSLLCRPGICTFRFPWWFYVVTSPEADTVREALADTLAFRYRPLAEARSLRSPKDAARLVRDWVRTERLRSRSARPLMKDPIALFSADWLADTFDMDVLLLIRHPAAFVNSLLRKGWGHPFEHFVRQPALMERLAPFASELESYAERPRPLFDQAILLWNVLHFAILEYRRARPEWTFARHEDVSRDPVGWFRTAYGDLGLTWSDEVRRGIEAHSASGNPAETHDAASHRRDSRASIVAWKRHLRGEEIDAIRKRSESLAAEWYGDDDW